jgi:hypothetical protein
MSNTEYTLEDVVGQMFNIEQAILSPNKNSFGQSVGDELNNIGHQLERIADALEKISNK